MEGRRRSRWAGRAGGGPQRVGARGRARTTAPLIVCYHAVSGTWPSLLAVSERALATQVAALRRRGFTGLTFSDAEQRRRAGTLPRRSLVITFDDGYASTLRAMSALQATGFPATVFVVTRFVESEALLTWDGIESWLDSDHADELRPLGWRDLERLVAAGWEVGSHTASHLLLTRLDDEALRRELDESRATLTQRLGACSSLAYPYGEADERVAAAARAAGYVAACTLTGAHRVDEPLRRPRVGLYRHDDGLRARVKLSPWARRARRTRVATLLEPLRRRD